ncbi:hypothetical protein CRE_28732 [Caenorhabditis remanei]|uniref:Uncharacterized protein n=1 Tax=Caenorhabditis remanei TaxID=31234 RepID=E3MK85_CAERE|nr:hypothetical protein CRE_28732 [Caenorhabditis remanei]
MYFWVKNCAFVNPPVKDSIDSGHSGYSSESGVSQESYNEEVDPKIKFYSTIILLLFLSVIPVYFITAGIVKHDECPAESKIPFWMVVIGSCFLFEVLFSGYIGFKDFKNDSVLRNLKNPETNSKSRPALAMILRKSINNWIHLELCRFVRRRELSQLLKLRNLA